VGPRAGLDAVGKKKTSLFLAGNQSMIPPKGTTVKRNTFHSLLYLRAQFKELIYFDVHYSISMNLGK